MRRQVLAGRQAFAEQIYFSCYLVNGFIREQKRLKRSGVKGKGPFLKVKGGVKEHGANLSLLKYRKFKINESKLL